jgi:hypothetical protein
MRQPRAHFVVRKLKRRVAGKTPMGKWAFIIEPLLRGLESEIADRQGLIRSNIDNKIRETEQIVSEIEPQDRAVFRVE